MANVPAVDRRSTVDRSKMAVRQSDLNTNGITPIQQMIASCSGALMTSLIVTPFDVIKIRLQAQRTPFYKGKCFLYCNGLMDHLCVCENGSNAAWYKAPGQFKGTLDAFVQIVRNEGLKSLWSGLPPTLIMAVPATVIYFTCYDQLRAFLKYKLGYDGAYIPLLAGASARVGAVTVISPLELIRTKSQSRKLTYRELGSVVRIAIAQDGWLSLWRGWGPTVLRDVPFSESRKTLTSTWRIMKRIVMESGFRGLFVGLLPRLMKVAPACAIMISSYEYGKSFFRKINRERELKRDLQSDIS
ncbi:probable mitochondrial glutathione transporter SLC25A40 isoform X4 [Stegostoma tigrinum]|uniref:probable mitochondrial glutathione transporter SLC25A40 isoform X4 n=1 Tax=Stegostoma tigrinum TaxID=3053191 RepID=UPI00202AC8C7|nr:probable mitochondrial glutathione transporter SLC25A40 isoform X4 [Stegostoma tigrinum]